MLAKEVREGPNAEDKAERLRAATGTSILLESTEVSSVPAEVVDVKTSVEESPVAVFASCCVGTLCICEESTISVAVVLQECRGLR